MADVGTLLVAAIPASAAVAGALLAGRASVRTTKVNAAVQLQIAEQNQAIKDQQAELEKNRANAEAVAQLRAWYEQILADMRRELERTQQRIEAMERQGDRLSEQLAKEQDVSNTLRSQIFTLQQQIRQFSADLTERERGMAERDRQLAELRRQVDDHTDPGPLPAPGGPVA